MSDQEEQVDPMEAGDQDPNAMREATQEVVQEATEDMSGPNYQDEKLSPEEV